MRAALVLVAGLLAAAATAAAIGADAPQTDFSQCAARYSAIGLPAMKTDGSTYGPVRLCRTGYAVAFNPYTGAPDWVIERLGPSILSGKAKRKNNFKEDPDLAAIAKAMAAPSGTERFISPTPDDYTGTKYDRGHQAPAGDFKSSQPMTDQSFYMSNMAPQVGVGFNRNIWKELETDVRAFVLCGDRPELYVMTGPVYYDSNKWFVVDKTARVRVPDAFFKVIYDPGHNRALGMLLPNKKLNTADLPKYAVPIADIEEATGIKFFPALSKRMHTVLTANKSPYWSADRSCSNAGGE